MKTIMVGDRIRNRTKECEVYAFDQMTRGYGNDNNRNSGPSYSGLSLQNSIEAYYNKN